ncbi:MAG: hypothetical protein ACK51D_12940 [Cyclobacteriaceae bacterium]
MVSVFTRTMPLEAQPIDELVLHLFIAQAKGVPEEQHLEYDLETDLGGRPPFPPWVLSMPFTKPTSACQLTSLFVAERVATALLIFLLRL